VSLLASFRRALRVSVPCEIRRYLAAQGAVYGQETTVVGKALSELHSTLTVTVTTSITRSCSTSRPKNATMPGTLLAREEDACLKLV
jgi:hypothetical protein